MAQRQARGAHNSEDIGSKPIAGIILHIASVHQGTRATLHLLSSEAERRTHNPEVGGSKPPGGIIPFACFTETGCQAGH